MSEKFLRLTLETVSNEIFYFPVKKFRLKYFLMILTVFVLFLIFKLPNTFNKSDSPLYDNRTINILFWRHFFHIPHNWYAEENGNADKKTLESVNCPVTNCFFTHNHRYLKNLADFDAIVIHGPEKFYIIPPHYSPKQLYIFASQEAPTFIRENLNRYKNYYNLTMTYRMDSDIQWDYGKILKIDTNEVIAPSKNPNWIDPDDEFFDEEYLKIFNNKTRSIAWFVSNCNAFNRRLELVKKMQEFIDIDIYGRCGNLSCNGPECDQLMTSTYKFYLSFENSLCQEYVTEKLFRALNQMTIPLTFNGVRDNRMYGPPKSFIDVNEFDTIENLVNYLKFLMNNPREYLKYFWWKKHYSVRSLPPFPYAYCELCQKLNNPTFMSEKHQIEDVKSWFFDDMCNQTSHIKF